MADTPRDFQYLPDGDATLGYIELKWTGLDGDDTGKPVNVSRYPDIQVQALSGTWGGSTLTFEGTLDERGDPNHPQHASAVWRTLTNSNGGSAISATGDTDVIQVLAPPSWIRPKTASGTGAAVVAYMKAMKRR